jgi:hypothetical protein
MRWPARWVPAGQQDELGPLPQQNPTDRRPQGPEQQTAGPVGLEVEDLTGQEDAPSQGRRAHPMQGHREPWRAGSHRGGDPVQPHHQHQQQGEAQAGGQQLPVGGNEQQQAGRQQHGAEAQGQPDRQSQTGRWDLGGFPACDRGRRGRVDQTRINPAAQQRFRVWGHGVRLGGVHPPAPPARRQNPSLAVCGSGAGGGGRGDRQGRPPPGTPRSRRGGTFPSPPRLPGHEGTDRRRSQGGLRQRHRRDVRLASEIGEGFVIGGTDHSASVHSRLRK